ncbi:MAG: hypothetical protein R8J84_03315 [Mariprofundales bacterium]
MPLSKPLCSNLRFLLVDIDARPELLDAIMKSSGPLYQHADGTFGTDQAPLRRHDYLATLRKVQMFEVRGKVDFSYLQCAVLQRFCDA